MKLLVAGDFAHSIFEPDFCHGLRECGATVSEFHLRKFLGPGRLLVRAQEKFLLGPGIALANAALIDACRREQPDALLCWRASWLHPLTLRAARLAGARRILLYNNDDPFGPDRDTLRWRRFRSTIPEADICFAFREQNLDDYRSAGAKEARLLLPWYRKDVHRPPVLSESDRARFASDVVFVGHCEDDDRLAMMDALFASGLSIKLFGTDWDKHQRGHAWAGLSITPVYGEDYLKAIAAAKVAVVFLSRRNRDQLTYRCFEIPAIGTAMLAPRNHALRTLFAEGSEIALYEHARELVESAQSLVRDPERRARMSQAAKARCERDGYDVVGRARELLADLERS